MLQHVSGVADTPQNRAERGTLHRRETPTTPRTPDTDRVNPRRYRSQAAGSGEDHIQGVDCSVRERDDGGRVGR